MLLFKLSGIKTNGAKGDKFNNFMLKFARRSGMNSEVALFYA
jgi:hypothetical protein